MTDDADELLVAERRVREAEERLEAVRRDVEAARDAFDREGTDAACAAVLAAEDRERVALAWVGRARRLRARASVAMLDAAEDDPTSALWAANRVSECMGLIDRRNLHWGGVGWGSA